MPTFSGMGNAPRSMAAARSGSSAPVSGLVARRAAGTWLCFVPKARIGGLITAFGTLVATRTSPACGFAAAAERAVVAGADWSTPAAVR